MGVRLDLVTAVEALGPAFVAASVDMNAEDTRKLRLQIGRRLVTSGAARILGDPAVAHAAKITLGGGLAGVNDATAEEFSAAVTALVPE